MKAVMAAIHAGVPLNKAGSRGEPPIFYALSDEQMPMLALLVKRGANVNVVDASGMTPLDSAAMDDFGRHPSETVVRFLIDRGANVNEKGKPGVLPAAWLCLRWAPLDLIKVLVAKGATYDKPRTDGTTAFMCAFANPSDDVVNYFLPQYHGELNDTCVQLLMAPHAAGRIGILLDNGADPNHTFAGGVSFVDCMALYGNLPAIKLLVAHGARISASKYILSGVIRRGDIDTVKYLVSQGASVDPAGTDQRPIKIAVESHAVDIVRYLLDNGASPNATAADPEAPLIVFAEQSNEQDTHDDILTIVKLLIDHGADVNVNDDEPGSSPGDTPTRIGDPLLSAYEAQLFDVADLLMQHGAKPRHLGMIVYAIAEHSEDADMVAKVTHLLDVSKGRVKDVGLSVAFGKPKLMNLLLDRGADPNLMTDGITELERAIAQGDLASALTLIQHGAKVDQVDARGNTALADAVLSMNVRGAQLLIAHGASVDKLDQSGNPIWKQMIALHNPMMKKLAAGHH